MREKFLRARIEDILNTEGCFVSGLGFLLLNQTAQSNKYFTGKKNKT